MEVSPDSLAAPRCAGRAWPSPAPYAADCSGEGQEGALEAAAAAKANAGTGKAIADTDDALQAEARRPDGTQSRQGQGQGAVRGADAGSWKGDPEYVVKTGVG